MPQPMSLAPTPPSSRSLPDSDGELLENVRHYQQIEVLLRSLEFAWKDRTDFYAAGNCFLYFSETQSRRNDFRGPDVFIVLGTDRRERRSWVVWEEGGKAPDVVIELISESTEHVDRNDKMRIYARTLKVGEYFLFDPWSGVLEGYSLDPERGSYVQKPYDERGRVFCAQTGFWLGKATSVLFGIEVPWLRWMDEAGNVLPLPVEQNESLESRAETAESRAETAESRAETAEARAAALEAELAALRARLP